MFVAFMSQLLMLASRMDPSNFAIVVFASSAIFIISLIHLCTFIIASISFNVLWYILVQSLLFSFNVLASSILLSFQVMYGLGEVGAVW